MATGVGGEATATGSARRRRTINAWQWQSPGSAMASAVSTMRDKLSSTARIQTSLDVEAGAGDAHVARLRSTLHATEQAALQKRHRRLQS